MSECVVRMDMPESCDACPCLDDYGDYPRCRLSEEQRGYNFPIHEKRMPNCPIITVLPERHGRLVDADAFKENMNYVCSAGGWLEPVTSAVTEYVKKHIDAQTVIVPADTAERSE